MKEIVWDKNRTTIGLRVEDGKGQILFPEYESAIDFSMYESFELTYEKFSCTFGLFSRAELCTILKYARYQLIHLIHFDAYVVVPYNKKDITIFIPSDSVGHVVGRMGRNIQRIQNVYGLMKINIESF